MHWIVQSNIRDEEGYQKFMDALAEQKVPHTTVKVVPFSHELNPDVQPDGPVIVWGSTVLNKVAQHRGWFPGTYLNENFDQRVWSQHYDTLNSDAEFHEFGSIPKYEGVRFIRPVHDMKVFAGTLVHHEELEKWQHDIQAISDGYATLTPQTPVSVSSVKNILHECRFFVVAGKVITGSSYQIMGSRMDMKLDRDFPRPDMWSFAQECASHWQPADAFVIDIACIETEHGETQRKVIEINGINACGFYAADMSLVIRAVNALH